VLQEPDLYNNQFGHQGALELVEALMRNDSSKRLVLDDTELGIEGASKIGYAISGQQTLEMFSCRDNSLSPEGETALLMSLRGVPLETLFLGKEIPLMTIVLFADFAELMESPLVYAVRHK
jgi:hypothetical protein